MPSAPLTILHILDHSLPLHSGYTFRSQEILRAQRQRGWRPLGLTSPRHEKNWQGPVESVEEINGFPYYRTGRVQTKQNALQAEAQLMRALTRRLSEVALQERPHLLHAHSPILNALPALWVGRKLHIPVVYEIRAFWEDAAVDHGSYAEGSWKYRLVRAIETWVCHRADQVAVLCQGLKNDLIARGIPAEKLTPVSNGVSVEDFSGGEPDANYRSAWQLAGKKVIGFIGSFYRYEGLDLLLEAFARLAAARSDVVLVLVGGGEVEAELKAQRQRLQLENRIVMPGRVAHDRIPGVYALMDVLVYPRYSMRLTELVTPLKPLEAMAMGKAVVASDIGGHRELLQSGETSLLFPPGDVAALTTALAHILDDVNLRDMGQRAQNWTRQKYLWEQTTAVYGDIYAKALNIPLPAEARLKPEERFFSAS